MSNKFNKQVRQLFAESKNISNKKFSYQQIEGLPEPVRRYFKHVLEEEQSYISYIRLKHDGQFKTDQKKDWVNIKGEQYFISKNPGFFWKGTTSMFVARGYVFGQRRETNRNNFVNYQCWGHSWKTII